MKYHRTSKEVREQIINRIKNEGVSVAQAAEEHDLNPSTIYGWLGTKAEGGTSVLEMAKLRRENDDLLRLVGGSCQPNNHLINLSDVFIFIKLCRYGTGGDNSA